MPLSPEDAGPITKLIEERNRRFEHCFAKRDAVALVDDYFVDDVLQPTASPPGGVPPVVGRAALVRMFTQQFQVIRAIRLETVRLETSTSMAFELGLAHLTLISGEAARGRYAVLWRQQGDDWRAAVDFFAEDGWT